MESRPKGNSILWLYSDLPLSKRKVIRSPKVPPTSHPSTLFCPHSLLVSFTHLSRCPSSFILPVLHSSHPSCPFQMLCHSIISVHLPKPIFFLNFNYSLILSFNAYLACFCSLPFYTFSIFI